MRGLNQQFLEIMKAKLSDLEFFMIPNNPFPLFTLPDYHPSHVSSSVAGLHPGSDGDADPGPLPARSPE